jgi:hypothetical protein
MIVEGGVDVKENQKLATGYAMRKSVYFSYVFSMRSAGISMDAIANVV